MKYILQILLLIFLLKSSVLNAQRTSSNKQLSTKEIENLAEEALVEDKFEKALILYKRLLANDNKNSRLNFLIGYCYLNTDYGKETSIQYLENSLSLKNNNDKTSAPEEAFYYLAKSYHINSKFSKAIQVLDSSIAKIPYSQVEFKNKAKRLKEYCENAFMISKSKINLQIESLLDINSKFSDYNPLLNSLGNKIIFTSRRSISAGREKSKDGQFDENIYISDLNNGSWSLSKGIDEKINSLSHDKACFISEDFSKLIIRKLDKHQGSLYISEKNNNEWLTPKKLGSNINTKYQETNGSLSPNGKQLFFVSNRKGSKGGTDIYVSEKMSNGAWGTARNLSNKINTIYDEETPFLDNNGTLFFSSKGHNSIGDFDIFASIKDKNGNWTEPVNLGLPINSVFDDFFYIHNGIGKRAFYSSKRAGGKGKSDVFVIELDTNERNDYIAISGKLIFKDKLLIKDSKITVINENSFDTVLVIDNFTDSGKYQLLLKADNEYSILYSYDNTIIHENVINSKPGGSILVLDQILILDDINIYPKTNVQFYQSIANNYKTTVIVSNPKFNNIVFARKKNNNKTVISSNNNSNQESTNVYSIKLANSKRRTNMSYFSNINNVKEGINKDSSYVYYVGEYIYEWEAEIQLRKIKEKYPDAQIFLNKIIKASKN